MTGDPLVEEVARILAAQKRHAGFFHTGDKHDTEETVMTCFLEATAVGWDFDVRAHRIAGLERPDAEITLADGRRIGLEITEFVNEDCRAAAARAREDPAAAWHPCDVDWTPQAILGLLAERLAAKSAKVHAPERFDAWWVLIFTDEPALDAVMVRAALADAEFTAPGIDRALFLMSYGCDPTCAGYPILDLPLARA